MVSHAWIDAPGAASNHRCALPCAAPRPGSGSERDSPSPLSSGRRVRFTAVDVDAEPALAERFGVRAMPTVVLLRDGREVGRVVGSRPRAFVAGMLDRALAGEVAIAAP